MKSKKPEMITSKRPWTKVLTSACLLSALTIGATTASANPIAHEPFDYDRVQGYVDGATPGDDGIGGLSGGFGWAGPWVKGGSLASGIPSGPDDYAPNTGWGVAPGHRTTPLSYIDAFGNRLETSGNQVRTAFGNSSWDRRTLAEPLGELGGTVWLSFLTQSNGIAATTSARWAFIELSKDAGDRLWMGKVTPVTSGNWGIQLPDRSPGAGGATHSDFGPDYPMNVPTLFVVKLDFPETAENNTTITIWLNPSDLSDENALGTPVFQGENNYVPYNQVGVAGRFSTDFDEIRLGHTFADVVPHELSVRDFRIENTDAMTVEFATEAGKKYNVLRRDGDNWIRLNAEPVVGDGQIARASFPAAVSADSVRVMELAFEDRNPGAPVEAALPSIAGLALHMDASNIDSLTLNGAFVEAWRDAQGRDIVFTPTVFPPEVTEPELRPIYGPLGPGGRPTLLFDRDSLDTRSPDGLALANDIEGITFFSVVMNNYDGSQNIFRMATVDGNTAVRFVQFRTPLQPEMQVRRSDTGPLSVTSGGERRGGEWEIDSSIIDFNTAQSQLFQNGMETGFNGTTLTPGRTDPTDSNHVRIGSSTNPNELANAWQGGIAEILFFNRALTLEERNQVGIYLSDKYALPYQVVQEADVSFDVLEAATLSFRADLGVEYRIEATNDLSGTWTDTGVRVTGGGFDERTLITVTKDADRQFFRVRILND